MFAECSGRFPDSFKWNLLLAIIEDGAVNHPLPHPRQRRHGSVLGLHYAVLARSLGPVEGFVGAAEEGGEGFLAGFAGG